MDEDLLREIEAFKTLNDWELRKEFCEENEDEYNSFVECRYLDQL